MMAWAEVIIGNLLLASLIGVLALIVGRGGRRAALAHALWIMFFVKLITPPIVAVPLPIPSMVSSVGDTAPNNHPLTQPAISPVAAEASDAVAGQTKRGDSAAMASSELRIDQMPGNQAGGTVSQSFFAHWTDGLLAIWLGGFLFLLFRGMARLVRFRRLLHQCGVDDEEATQTVAEFLSAQPRWLFARQSPRVVRVSVRVSPMLFGFAMRPIIVCPEQLWQSLSKDDRRAFLAHETAHFYRRDHWVRWLEWIVSAVYWWFPGVYFGQRQLERHEEACCDAWAVKMLSAKPRHYAEALLRVVDFISDYGIGLPSLASGMQPTDTLEERLRLLMRNELDQGPSRLHTWSSSLACAAIWMIHPDAYHLPSTQSSLVRQASRSIEAVESTLPEIIPETVDRAAIERSLPEAPNGFWNDPPVRHWAGFSFSVSGFRLSAIAGKGFLIDRADGDPLVFEQRSLTAIAEVPATGRVIVGDADGYVRLWDFKVGMPISLLGRHNSEVTSLAVGPEGAVFSADAGGSVIRWEMQSGQTLAQWSDDERGESTGAIQSIRLSADGGRIAVLCGDWRQTTVPKVVCLLDSHTLSQQTRQTMNPDTAIVVQNPSGQWCAINWQGEVREIITNTSIDRIEKHRVSALLLSQHASLNRPAQKLTIAP